MERTIILLTDEEITKAISSLNDRVIDNTVSGLLVPSTPARQTLSLALEVREYRRLYGPLRRIWLSTTPDLMTKDKDANSCGT